MEYVLEAKNLTKTYGKFTAVDSVSFGVAPKSKVLLLGANGAGKSTIVRCLMGQVSFKGALTLGGMDVKREGKKVRKLIGYVPQELALYDNLSVYTQSMLMAKLKGCPPEEIKKKLEERGMWEVRSRAVRALSRGMKQRFSMALALMGDPPVLVFDEPTAGVDMNGQLDFLAMMNSAEVENKTLIIATHLPGLSEFSDQVIVLDKGKIVARGSPKDLLSQINSKDLVYIRLKGKDAVDKISEIASQLKAEVIGLQGEWLKIALFAETKYLFIQALIDHGIKFEDMMIEHPTIESEYMNLLRKAS